MHEKISIYALYANSDVGRCSSVCIATRYQLDSPGIESRLGGEIFRTRPDRLWGLTQPTVQWVPDVSWGLKRPGRGVDHPLPYSAEVEGRVELYSVIQKDGLTS